MGKILLDTVKVHGVVDILLEELYSQRLTVSPHDTGCQHVAG